MKRLGLTVVLLSTVLFVWQPVGLFAQTAPEGFVRINGGTFTMGDSNTLSYGAQPPHQVTVSGFYMGKYEVTQAEYEVVMGTNPSYFKGSNLPVESVTWFDAIEYCIKRSQREGLTPAYTMTGRTPASGYPIEAATVTWNRNANGYRLPTEAEWEYAARAGTTTSYYWGNQTDAATVGQYAWYYENSSDGTKAVGTKRPNAFGLYDMSGNVWEWCWDWYSDYTSTAKTDPTGASTGDYRVLRGGRWGDDAVYVRSSGRNGSNPYYQVILDGVGFRLVRP